MILQMNSTSNVHLSSLFEKYQEHINFDRIKITHVNQKGLEDDMMIHIAARMNKLEDVKLLIENNAEINLQGDCGYTPLHYACRNGNDEMVKILLLNHADPFIKNEWGDNAFDIVEKLDLEKNKKVLKKYLKNRHRIKTLY